MNEEGHAPCLVSFQDGYIYELAEMLTALEIRSSTLYGKYCGTYLLDVYSYFRCRRSFRAPAIQHQPIPEHPSFTHHDKTMGFLGS